MSKLISVIVPVYNVENFLEKCIDTIINQTYRNIEIILVDDGSKDRSGELCDLLSLKDERIKVFHKDNGGLTSAWIYGLKHTSIDADFVVFVDSDDWIEKRHIELMVEEQEKNATDVVVMESKQVSINHMQNMPFMIKYGFYNKERIKKEIYPILLDTGFFEQRAIPVSRWGKLIKKSLLLDNIKYCNNRTTFAEDLNIIFPVFLDMNSISIITGKNAAYCYRMNMESMLHAYDKNKITSVKYVYPTLIKVCIDKNKREFIRQIYTEYLAAMIRCFTNELQNPGGFLETRKNIKNISEDMLLKKVLKKAKYDGYPKQFIVIINIMKHYNWFNANIIVRILRWIKTIHLKRMSKKWSN